jgi:hypothetical protein
MTAPTRPGGTAPPEDLIDIGQLMKVLEDEPEIQDQDDSLDSTQPVPKITRMPEGMEVVEHHIGHAVARWILQVRCDCGRRWFEVDAVRSAHCPRCGTMVLIDIEDPAADPT